MAQPRRRARAKNPGEEEDGDDPVPDDITANFNAEEATQEVWAGADPEMAETVRVCLRENGIGCVVEDAGGESVVLVMPESQKRAKGIIGEIVRGTPMAYGGGKARKGP